VGISVAAVCKQILFISVIVATIITGLGIQGKLEHFLCENKEYALFPSYFLFK
jgi:hypothetical protein